MDNPYGVIHNPALVSSSGSQGGMVCLVGKYLTRAITWNNILHAALDPPFRSPISSGLLEH